MVDTWPDDGGWELEMVVVRLQRFGERRMLPVDAMIALGRVLRVAVHALCRSRTRRSRARACTAPTTRTARIAYWRCEEPGGADIVPPQWRRSSGFFVTERPSPTSPSPMPIAS